MSYIKSLNLRLKKQKKTNAMQKVSVQKNGRKFVEFGIFQYHKINIYVCHVHV